MIIPDINLLLYVHNQDDERHAVARSWWEGLLDDVGIPLAVSLGFIRLATDPRVISPPTTSRRAVSTVQSWLQMANIAALDASPANFDHLQEYLEAPGRAGKFVSDAHLAALALDHDAEIHSADQDFRVFPNVRCFNLYENIP